MKLSVLYHQSSCIVVNKTAGIQVQAPPSVPSVAEQVKTYLRQKEDKTGKIYLGVPHRLDRPVSGTLVFARHIRAARALAEQFAHRKVSKIYYAVIEGCPPQPAGILEDWVRKIPGRPQAEICHPKDPDAKDAHLEYRLLQNLGPNRSLLEIQLLTGRYHQIRVQLGQLGTPIVGDTLYGASQPILEATVEDPKMAAIALHAGRISFFHPQLKIEVTVQAPFPALWSEFGDLFNDIDINNIDKLFV